MVQAVRPMARSLSVLQGKGRTAEAARVSALMEAAEFWPAENAGPGVRGEPGEMSRRGRVLDLEGMTPVGPVPPSLPTAEAQWVSGVAWVCGRD